MKICVVTYHELGEPRGPRHAIAAKRAFPDAEVIFIHYRSGAAPDPVPPASLRDAGIETRALTFPTRASDPLALARRRIAIKIDRALFQATGHVREGVFSERTRGLTRTLIEAKADIYFAHNFEALMPAARACEHWNAVLVFDCMEFYSDMGDGQRGDVARAIQSIEARWLPDCSLVVAASDELAEAYAHAYRIQKPLAAYNVPAVFEQLPPKQGGGLNLYWRNNVLGFGQRGLEDILAALARLPEDVRLFLQGNLGHDGGQALRQRIAGLGLASRVTILPPHAAGDAVPSAAAYDIGLCLERKGPRNHDLTVSNKMFDYHMAGLAVVASGLPGLATVIRRSRGGVVYTPGDAVALAAAIADLRSNPVRLAELQRNARAFALAEGNLEVETTRIVAALKAVAGNRTVHS